MILLLLRHGETDWNRNGQVMGRRPIPLNSRGEEQARRLAATLRSKLITELWSSPALRAQQTANILAATLRCSVETEPGLNEVDMGTWEGRFWKDLSADWDRNNFYTAPGKARPPSGECLQEVQVRAIAVIQRLRAESTRKVIGLVTHADVVRVIMAHHLGINLHTLRQFRIDPASVTALELCGDEATLLYVNNAASAG